jgi:signal transduction histidine kinase/ligand-binding sensor domain-containing protein/DNA-binding response OmpR family regulator
MKSRILLISSLLFFQIANAQFNRQYSTKDGLSGTSINKIIQDKRGFLWIATNNGLNKFDGDRFTYYGIGDGCENGLTDNLITSLFIDNESKLWIGTHSGVWSFSLISENFSSYPVLVNDNSIFDFFVTDIAQNSKNELFISTSGRGIKKLNPEKNVFENDPKLEKSIPTQFVKRIFFDKQNTLYATVENNGIYIYDSTRNRTQHFTSYNSNIVENQIVAIASGRNKDVYIGTTGGISIFNKLTNSFETIADSRGLTVANLFLAPDSTIYVSTDGNGIFFIDKQNQLQKFNPANNLANDLINKTFSLLVDKDNNIWCGINYKGLMMLGKSESLFYNIDCKTWLGGVSDMCVYSIYANNNQIWFGTDGDGILISTINEFKNAKFKRILPTKKVLSIFEDKSQNVWLATWNDGLICVDKNKLTIKKQYKRVLNNPNSLSNDRLWSIAQDNNNYLWLATNGDGLCRFDTKNETFTTFKAPDGSVNNSKYICNNWVNCLLTDNENNLWAGTTNGISKLNLKNMVFSNFLYAQNKNKGISVKSITLVNNTVWIGTDKGIYIFNKKANEWDKITTPELNLLQVSSIVYDKHGSVWVSGFNRAFKININNFNTVVYTASEGIQIPEFQRNAMTITPDGHLFFGGINGCVELNPNRISNNRKLEQLVLTELLMYNKPVNVNQLSGGKPIITTNINDAQNISMAYKDCFFTVRFKIMNFINSDQVTYYYMMEGYDKNWQSLPPNKDKSATYTNLAHGNYKFKVKAVLNDLVQMREINVRVLPPWWATWWMKILYLLIVSGFVLIVYKYIKAKEKEKTDREKLKHLAEINEMKLQFFMNISHEIRTPITLILSPLERLLKEANELNRDLFQMMYRNAQRLLNLVNQIMDVRKIDKGLFQLRVQRVELLSYLRNLASDFQFYTDEKQIELTVDSDFQKLYVFIDPMHFEKVIINLLSNAFKFSPPDSDIILKVSVCSDNNALCQIEVIDSGIGIEEDLIESIFDRFIQSGKPIPKNSGTGIGLHLCRQLVTLHHGTIKAHNRPVGKGAIFCIDIPFGRKHFLSSEIDENIAQPESNKTIANEHLNTRKEKIHKTKPTIHLVEDDDEIRNYLAKELEENYLIEQSFNADVAVKSIFTNPPDLIISDVMMPGLDGVSFCKRVRNNHITAHVPIILLTAKNTIESEKDGLAAGADEYMIKPFNIDLLKTRIDKLIEMRRTLQYHFEKKQQMELPDIEILSHNDKLMKRINQVLTDNLSNEQLNVSFLCKSVGISRVHLNRKMHELVNISAQDYIRIFKFRYAEKLLKDKKMSIAEVAYSIGFANHSHFTYRFRLYYGVTPTEFMESEGKDVSFE